MHMRPQDVHLRSGPGMTLVLLVALAFLAVVMLMSASAGAEGPGGGDAGNDLDGATAIGEGSWDGTIFRNETEEDLGDYYVYAYTPGKVVLADVVLADTSSTHLDVKYKVFDRDRSLVISNAFSRLDAPVPFAELTNDETPDPVYYLAVMWEGSSLLEFTVNYTLTVTSSNTTQDDAGSGGDAPRTQDGATTVTYGEYNGSVGDIDLDWNGDANADGGDMYVLTPDAGLFIRFQLTLTQASIVRERNLAMSLENSTGGVLEFVSVGEEGRSVSFRYFAISEADLYLNLTSSAVINNYTLVITSRVPGADGSGKGDAGEEPDHAMDLTLQPMPGALMRGMGAEDLADYYELEFPSSQFVEVEMTLRTGTASPGNIRFRVLDYTKAEVINFTFSGLDEPRRFAGLTNSEHAILRYYLGVTWEGSEDVDFEFRYDIAHTLGPGQDDMGKGEDVGNTNSGAPTVSLDTPVDGSVGGSNPQWEHDANVDGADVYEVLPTMGRFVVVSGRLNSFHASRRVGFDVQLEDQSGKLVHKPLSAFEVGDELEMRVYASSGLPIYIRVTSESEMCNYTLVVSMEDPPELDLFVGNLSVVPARPGPGTEATITVIVASTELVNPATQIRVEVYAGGNLLDYADVILDNSDQETVTFPWTVPSADTDITAAVDTLNAIPWEAKDNNEASIQVKVGRPDDGNGNGGDGGPSLMIWIVLLVVVIIVAILVSVAYVMLRRGSAEDEEPEDY
jgi:hypothetical protein